MEDPVEMPLPPLRVVAGDEMGYVKVVAAPNTSPLDIATSAVVARWGASAHRRLGVEALAAALDAPGLPSTSAAWSPMLAGTPRRAHCHLATARPSVNALSSWSFVGSMKVLTRPGYLST